MRDPTKSSQPRRRGTSIAALVLMIAVINMAVVSLMTATSENVVVRAMSIDSTRALYALDSGVMYAATMQARGEDLSKYQTEIPFSIANDDAAGAGQIGKVCVVRGPAQGEAGGDIVLRAWSGAAVRRVETQFWVR